MPDIRFVQLSALAMEALIAGDLPAASAAVGVPLSAFLIEENSLWQVRLPQILADPTAAPWVAQAVLGVPEGVVVGHAGFHGPPDERGTVEVGYTVDPGFRRRGYATAILAALVARAEADPRVHTIRASIQPTNVASRATVAKFGFRKIGEQWDARDGLEDVFARTA